MLFGAKNKWFSPLFSSWAAELSDTKTTGVLLRLVAPTYFAALTILKKITQGLEPK